MITAHLFWKKYRTKEQECPLKRDQGSEKYINLLSVSNPQEGEESWSWSGVSQSGEQSQIGEYEGEGGEKVNILSNH